MFADLASGVWATLAVAALLTTGLWRVFGPRPLPASAGDGGDRRYRRSGAGDGDELLLATYNIHGGEDAGDCPSLDRIAEDLRQADIIALQEVHDSFSRPGQLNYLAERLGMEMLASPTRRAWRRNERSNALLSRFPLGRWIRVPLPHQHGRHRHFRNLTLCEVPDAGGLVVLFTHINTHKGSELPGGRADQLRAVLARFVEHSPAVLMGDLNTHRDDPLIRALMEQYPDVEDVQANYAARDRNKRRDWILTRGLDVVEAGFHDSGASDHPMYWCRVRPRAGTASNDVTLPGRIPENWLPDRPDSRWVPWTPAGFRPWLVFLVSLSVLVNGLAAVPFLVGCLMLVPGGLLEVFARAQAGQDRRRDTSGRCALLCHPQYVAAGLTSLGLAVISGFLPLVLLVPFWWALVHLPRACAGDRRAATISSQARDDPSRVPACIPRLSGLSGLLSVPPGAIWWREAGGLLRLAACPLLFLLVQRLSPFVETSAPGVDTATGWLAGALAGMVFVSLAWDRRFVDGRRLLPGWLPRRMPWRGLLLVALLMGGLIMVAVVSGV